LHFIHAALTNLTMYLKKRASF